MLLIYFQFWLLLMGSMLSFCQILHTGPCKRPGLCLLRSRHGSSVGSEPLPHLPQHPAPSAQSGLSSDPDTRRRRRHPTVQMSALAWLQVAVRRLASRTSLCLPLLSPLSASRSASLENVSWCLSVGPRSRRVRICGPVGARQRRPVRYETVSWR